MAQLTKVFVYGTLRRGETNSCFMQPAVFVGKAKTCQKFPLVIGSPLNCPLLLNEPGTGHHITGEVYDVTAGKLQGLFSAPSPTINGKFQNLFQIGRIRNLS